MVKSIFDMPMIPKEVAFKLFCDLSLREKWDKNMANYQILEQNDEMEELIFHYTIPMPKITKSRDVLLKRIIRRNYPANGSLAIHSKSYDHYKVPVDEKKSYRVDCKINGMIIEDVESKGRITGTKISWVFQNDVKGNFPKVFINERSVKVPKEIAHNWIKESMKFMKEKGIAPL